MLDVASEHLGTGRSWDGTLLTRQDLADPHWRKPYLQRLAEAGAVDLRDNVVVVELEGGYVRVEPVDPNKRHGTAGEG